jgi:hypothetical protein
MFNAGRAAIWAGLAIPGTATIKARLCMSNANCATLAETTPINHVSGLTTDTCDAVGYTEQTLGTVAATRVDAGPLVKLTAAAIDWGSLPASTRQVIGVLVYVFVTNDAASFPLFWDEFATPKTLDGTDFQTTVDPTYGFGAIG